MASVHTDALYGKDYKWDRCGKLSPACEKWFVEEACFYECDVNIAKFRVEQECNKADGTANDNLWQVMGVPMKASQCDQWYEDCKDDPGFAGLMTGQSPDGNVDSEAALCKQVDQVSSYPGLPADMVSIDVVDESALPAGSGSA